MQVNMENFCEMVHYSSYFAQVTPNTRFLEAVAKLYSCLYTKEGDFENLYEACLQQKRIFVRQIKKNCKGQPWEFELLEPLETFNLWFNKFMQNMCDVHNNELGVENESNFD